MGGKDFCGVKIKNKFFGGVIKEREARQAPPEEN